MPRTVDLGNVMGAKGEQGEPGKKGDQGESGKQAPSYIGADFPADAPEGSICFVTE